MSGRKVRKNFDKNKGYSVNVTDCTEEMKKAVQQAFFDVGIDWLYKLHSCEYQRNGCAFKTSANGTKIMRITEKGGILIKILSIRAIKSTVLKLV